MDAFTLHLELRNALSLSDELGRHEHAIGNDSLAGQLAALRTALGELERDVGRSHDRNVSPNPTLVERLERGLHVLRDRLEEIPAVLRPRLGQLLASVERIIFAELRPRSPIPSKPLLGILPLKRLIPQDVHSVMDYLVSAAYLVSARLATTKRARAVGLLLGSNVGGVSLLTDYRLSAAKVIPIEVHEVLDHVSGAGGAAAPFVLGYAKKDRIAATIQIAAGIGTILASLFTDYRAARGVGRAIRSRGGPYAGRYKKQRVPEVQRPLEGLSSPSFIPRLEV
jgi:hypothetical protein